MHSGNMAIVKQNKGKLKQLYRLVNKEYSYGLTASEARQYVRLYRELTEAGVEIPFGVII